MCIKKSTFCKIVLASVSDINYNRFRLKEEHMMAKPGRPKCEDPSLHKVSVRLTETEYQKLKLYAESNNLTMTQAMKRGIDIVCDSTKG